MDKTHCDEVERLMAGKTPFVTRHGITTIMAVMAVLLSCLLLADGSPRRLAKDMAAHIREHVLSKNIKTDNSKLWPQK